MLDFTIARMVTEPKGSCALSHASDPSKLAYSIPRRETPRPITPESVMVGTIPAWAWR